MTRDLELGLETAPSLPAHRPVRRAALNVSLSLFCALAFTGLAACAPPPLVAQDVSFLVPLEQGRDFLPAATVLPRELFDHLPPLTVVDEPDALYAALSVVSVRLDACFREGATPGPCQPQVRLVLQPVFDEAGGVTTRDAAVHVFFSTSEAELVELVRTLPLLRSERGLAAPAGFSSPHPGFADQTWVKRLRERLLPLLGASRIVRITSMSVHASNLAWIFSGSDYAAGQPTDIVIPTLGGTLEDHVTSTGKDTAVEVTVDPASPSEPALMPVIAPGGLARATPAELSAAATSVKRLEDPATHNPGTVDCATCHVAALAHRALSKSGVTVDGDIAPSSAFDDTREPARLRLLLLAPAISPRVQRETALVRDDFAKRLEK